MESLLFTLTLGFFLMVLPYLSGGAIVVTMTMPSKEAIKAEMKVKCDFRVENAEPGINEQVMRMSLLRGYSEPAIAEYIVGKREFDLLSPSNGIKLEIAPETTVKNGSLTFVINRLACKDFTWYVCSVGGGVDSQNTTLQVLPAIYSIRSSNVHVVHQMSVFTCSGMVSKEGSFSVQWYRKNITPRSQLTAEEAKVTSQDQCSRIISSIISYNVSESDIPALILWCQIEEDGLQIYKGGNFTIQVVPTVNIPEIPTGGGNIIGGSVLMTFLLVVIGISI